MQEDVCHICQREDPEQSEDGQQTYWIQCYSCKKWFHQVCAGASVGGGTDDIFWESIFCVPVNTM
ncbi:JmjC domain-containing histone demethylation protein 1 [Desmophyllum pertusum]|uniref:JmjC domain-containing histone demethylation protein 1 n=1 Tax=Desmophyllum pertusum TaxID=174260 RepID=A0A9W9ZFF6_9CNID|nr:JmjC domain-containing histone demethylation protein 1 [Desmophyllum pertusum]